MINISQNDFEDKIKAIIRGDFTRKDLAKELKTDRVTLNNKIQELSNTNPELYLEFIFKFPYRPRKYTHINYEAMIIEIMKQGYTARQAEDEYGISRRTIQRKLNVIEKENPRLYQLYSSVMYYRKHRYDLPDNLKSAVENLETKEVFIGGICDQRETELLEKERKFIESRMAGLSDAKAHGKSARAEKTLSTLYRIELENNANPPPVRKTVTCKKNKTPNNPDTNTSGPEDR